MDDVSLAQDLQMDEEVKLQVELRTPDESNDTPLTMEPVFNLGKPVEDTWLQLQVVEEEEWKEDEEEDVTGKLTPPPKFEVE